MNDTRPISLLICALGGEGGGVLTEWLVDIARHAGYAAQSTSIPGVAQRTGATTYYLEVFPVPLARLGGRKPVFSLNPVPGALDAMVSSELLETARQIGNGMSSPQRTLVIASSSRTLTTQERMQPADGRADSDDLLQIVRRFSREHHVFDMAATAREAGTVVSAVMLGAVAGSGLLPFPRSAYETVIRGGDAAAPVSKMAAASLRGFALAWDQVSQPRVQAARVEDLLQEALDSRLRGNDIHSSDALDSRLRGNDVEPPPSSPRRRGPRASAPEFASATATATATATAFDSSLSPRSQGPSASATAFDSPSSPRRRGPRASAPESEFESASVPESESESESKCATAPAAPASWLPAEAREMFALGHARMLEYQGPAYAQLYVRRLEQVLAAERAADPEGARGFATTREMARWLALWMAFDDIVRVADLKSRSSRWQRVQGEVKVGDGDLLRVYDHFKPGVPEFAALLPPALSLKLLRWDRQRVLKGKAPWALPLKVGTHSVFGMLSLRLLAGLKWLRVRGARYAGEQAMIEKWLAGVVVGTRSHWQLGHEIALCGRLIKGYGATNERGKENLLHVLDHLASAAQPPEVNAAAIAAARSAALADDAGIALDATLLRHGAPARPVKEQPLRFVRRTPALNIPKKT